VRGPRDQLLRELAEDLAPAPRLAPAAAAASLWFGAAALFVAAITRATGPLRPGVGHQLLSDPGFLLNIVIGVAAALVAIRALTRLRIPGVAAGGRSALPALLLLAAWFGLQGLGWLLGEGPASTLGARPYCWLQALSFSLLPLAAALLVARRAAPLERVWTGLLAGIAAGTLGSLAMQVGCTDTPLHALVAHLLPLLAVAAPGALLARRVLPPV
jgi:hypothetical protein